MKTDLKQKKLRLFVPRIGAVLMPLAGFLVILATLNGYQYFKLKSNLAEPVINQISDTEIRDLQHFFDSVSTKLKMVRDWGRNGLLTRDPIDLNKKFIPLLDHQDTLTGIVLADNKGYEYFLHSDGQDWVTRIRMGDKQNILQYQRWQKPDQSIEQWQKKSDYSPQQRPWFHSPEQEDGIHWTPAYTFHEKKIQGVSASVSWKTEEQTDNFSVFSMDIPLTAFQELLSGKNNTAQATLFLVNPYTEELILGHTSKKAKKALPPDLISDLISEWKTTGQPAQKIVRLNREKQDWLATFRPMLQQNAVIWVGVAASEKKLVSNLNKTLFDIDLIDLLVACAGGGAMLLLVWLNGGLHPAQNEPVDPLVRLHQLVNQGEGNKVEFKSTIRMNLKRGKNGKEIEFAWLKAVIAFLNSDGGTLLIGVADDGEILGLEADNFDNDDRCLLHIKNLFNHHVGAEFSGFVDVDLIAVEDKMVAMLTCRPAGEPVFLKIGKNEEFYIRSGPSNSKLSPSQMISYIQQKEV